MRSLFTAIAVLGFCGCASIYTAPYMNLRHPIYMVTDPSFLTGCENDPAGYEACRMMRIRQVNNGVNLWFNHFDVATRPKVVIVNSEKELPAKLFNQVIYLKVEQGACTENGKEHPACYDWESNIVFDKPNNITPFLSAHEFGHVLGRSHRDTPKEIASVMSYDIPSYVVPVDIDILCSIHSECPPHENTWCEGGFYDECYCPSASYEEGVAKLKAGKLTCESGEFDIQEANNWE